MTNYLFGGMLAGDLSLFVATGVVLDVALLVLLCLMAFRLTRPGWVRVALYVCCVAISMLSFIPMFKLGCYLIFFFIPH